MIKEIDLISVVIPVYNVEIYLRKCINSILQQTYKNLDIILVDDGSTDRCGAICDEFANLDLRVRVFHKENGGLSDARNYGIDRAMGKYITFIDSDDFIEFDYIEYLYKLLVKYKCSMSLTMHNIVLKSHYTMPKKITHKKDEKLSKKKCIEKMLYHDEIDTCAWGKLYDIELFSDIRYPKGKIFEDMGTTYKLFLKCDEIACGYENKYNYIIRKDSIVNGKFHKGKLDLIKMTDEMAADVEKVYPDLSIAVTRRRVYARFSTLNQMLDISELKDIREEFIKFIFSNKKAVIGNPKAPKRDKIAIFLLQLGFSTYTKVWKIVRKIYGK